MNLKKKKRSNTIFLTDKAALSLFDLVISVLRWAFVIPKFRSESNSINNVKIPLLEVRLVRQGNILFIEGYCLKYVNQPTGTSD